MKLKPGETMNRISHGYHFRF